MTHEQTAGGIFINYRQRDGSNSLCNHAVLVEALSRRLARHFDDSMVFVDVSLSSGTRYPDELRARLTSCHVLLAVIHPEWLEDLNQRKSTHTRDWVHDEISIALNGNPASRNHHKRFPVVIPILLENAELPATDELPDDIQKLADRKSFRLRSGSLADDIDRLVRELERHVPTSWKPSRDTGPNKLDDHLSKLDDHLSMPVVGVVGTSLCIVLILLGDQSIHATLSSSAIISLLFMSVVFLLEAARPPLDWLFRRTEKRLEPQSEETSRIVVGGISGGGSLVIVGFSLFVLIDSGWPQITKESISWMILLFGLLFMINIFLICFVEEEAQKFREWPPRVLPRDYPVDLKRAALLLEQRLTSSWRPPLSRVQRDQAQHIVQKLSEAVVNLRDETQRSRWDWLRTAHRKAAVTYAIWLIVTIVLAVASIYLLIATTEYRGRLLYLATATPVLASALSFGAMDLSFRNERREKRWLAEEIENRLKNRLLPHLPTAIVVADVSRTGQQVTAQQLVHRPTVGRSYRDGNLAEADLPHCAGDGDRAGR